MTHSTSFLLSALTILCIGYGCLMTCMYLYQRHLIYRPDTKLLAASNYDLPSMETLALTTEDGMAITAWYHPIPPQSSLPLILYFHGNTGHIGDRANKLRHFIDAGFGILAISYRGYGTSSGAPTEQGLYQDARAALAYTKKQDIPLNQIILYGESLGSGVAVQMATEYNARMLVLEAPYTSLIDLAHQRFPFIPTSLLLKDHFNSADKIQKVQMPLLVMHGEKDLTIPVRFGKQLLALANEPKRGVFFASYHHTDFDPLVLIDTMKIFLARH